jgi:hypothetical protein
MLLTQKLIKLDSKLKRLPFKLLQFFVIFFLPSQILNGAFKNTPLQKNWIGSSMLPKILGTYEREVAAYVKQILKSKIDAVINIGCAGGYYLSVADFVNKKIDLIGIDNSANAIRELAILNRKRKKKITLIQKFAEIDDFYHFAKKYQHPFFIIDIESAEFSLFQKLKNKKILMNSFLFIEIHKFSKDFYNIGEFFEKTHHVKIIPFRNYFLRSTFNVSEFFKLLIIHEFRNPNTEYLILKPKKFIL